MIFRLKSLPLLIPILLSASVALGSTLSVLPGGNGSFVIQGSGMDGVAGIDLNVAYDAATLGSPTIGKGSLTSSAMIVPNPNTPGTIRIAIISTTPFAGSGSIATLSFATHTGTGRVSVAATSAIDKDLRPLPLPGPSSATDYQTVADTVSGGSTTSNTNGGSGTGNGASSGTTPSGGTSDAARTGTSLPAILGTVTMPGSNTPQPEAKPATPTVPIDPPPAASEKTERAEQPAPEKPSENDKSEVPALVKYDSPLERFRDYRGERTPAHMIALLTDALKSSPLIRQEPPLAISDGTTSVRVSIELPKARTAPNFALSGARTKSIGMDEESGKWILDIVPQEKVLAAGITILNGASIIELPLAVVPPAKGVAATESDFVLFLKDDGAKKPTFDLNGDGKHDYVDNYIYTAHYLLKKGQAEKAPPKQK